jgi:hypothetical protein
MPTTYTRADLVREAQADLGIILEPIGTATRTRIELVDAAARVLGDLAVGQTLTAESSDIIDGHVDTVIANLNARHVTAIANANAIPISQFDPLSTVVALAAQDSFSLGAADVAQLTVQSAAAEVQLANLNRAVLVDRNLDGILAELATDDLVYVTDDSNIPQEWFMSLHKIVADRMKGNFSLAADVLQRVAAEGTQAMQTLRRTTRGRPSYNRFVPEWF